MWGSLKRVVVGVPIATSEEHYQRLTKKIALAVFASDAISVVIPEVVGTHWFTNVLHNQSALALEARLLYRPNTVVTSVPVIVD